MGVWQLSDTNDLIHNTYDTAIRATTSDPCKASIDFSGLLQNNIHFTTSFDDTFDGRGHDILKSGLGLDAISDGGDDWRHRFGSPQL